VIQFVNVFLFGNEYITTPLIGRLIEWPELAATCIDFISTNAVKGDDDNDDGDGDGSEEVDAERRRENSGGNGSVPSNQNSNRMNMSNRAELLARVFRLYCALKPGIPYRELCLQFDTLAMGVDDRKLIVFGELNHLIRLHKFAANFQKHFTSNDLQQKQ
jgi:hypothetical protein